MTPSLQQPIADRPQNLRRKAIKRSPQHGLAHCHVRLHLPVAFYGCVELCGFSRASKRVPGLKHR